MHTAILLLLLTSFSLLASCFNCSDLSQKSQCSQLEGCLWNSNSSNCEGTFNPLCLPPICYYIDNSTQAAIPAGTPTDPFSTLSDGLIKLANSSGSLIIMNYRNNTSTLLDMISGYNISTNIIIKPLISGNYYQISLTNLSSLTAPSSLAVSGQLTIIEAIFNYTYTYRGISTLFTLKNGTLSFQRVIVQPPAQLAQFDHYIVIIDSSFPSSKFYYEGGQISVKYSTFVFRSGFGHFKNVKVINMVSMPIEVKWATLIVENCYFSGWQNYIFSVNDQANFSMSGCLCEQGNYGLITALGNANITIQGTIFRDMTSNISTITSRQDSLAIASFTKFPLTIRDSVFENMTVNSIIYTSQLNLEVWLINVTMNNIRRIPSERASYTLIRSGSDYTLGACCLIRMNATLNVISSRFTNINSTCIHLYQSRGIVNSTVFDNSGIGIEKSSLTIDPLANLELPSGTVWILINQPSYPISIDSSKFIKNTLLSMQGGAIRLIGSKQIQFSLTSNEFIENIAYYGGAIYIDNPLLLLKSTQNIFTGNSAFEGGAIYKKSYSLLQKPFFPSFIMEGNNYTGNTAIRAGGAVYASGDSLQITKERFVNGSARIGGGLYAINVGSDNTDTPLSLSGVTFANNTASQFGSCIVAFSDMKEDQCIFENNIDPLNQPVISQRPSYFLFSFYDVIIEKEIYSYDDLSAWTTNTSRTKLAFTLNTTQSLSNQLEIKHKSGTEIKQIMKIEAYDEHGQILSFAGEDDQILAHITEIQNSVSNFQAYLKSSPLILSFTQGRIFLKTSLRIFGETNSKATLNFKSLNTPDNILYETNFIMDQNIQISFIPCEIGDIYDASSKSCNPCPSGTYSLEDPYKSPICRACVDNAECLGGSKIAPLPGYWRFDTETAVIMQCQDETACKGGYVDEIYYSHGACSSFNEGKLCSACALNYAKFGSSETCFDCQSTLYSLKLFGFFGLYIMGIMLNFKYASQKEKASSGTLQDKGVLERPLANEELRFSILKIVISFIQISSIVVQYNFGWPKQALEIVQITNKIMPVGQDAFSIDCFIALTLGANDYTHFIKLIVTGVRPVIVWITIISGYNISKAINERNPRRLNFCKGRKQLILLLIITFVDQPHIILIALETFKCQTYESSQGSVMFMFKDSQVECWTGMHIVWSVIAGAIFLIWGIILPILLFRKIQQIHKRDKGSRSEDYFKCRYIMGSVKPRWYYWEFILLLRRSLVIIVFVCKPLLSDLTQISLILIIFWCFTGIYTRVKPYKDERLNRLELNSLITLMVITYTGVYSIDDPDTSKWNALIIFMLIANISFYLLSVYYFAASYLQKPPSRTKKASSEVETNKGIQNEKKSTSFLSLRSPAPSLEGQAIEDILQSLEIELDEYENGRLKKQESPKTFFALNSMSSEPDLNSEGNNTDIHKITKSILNLKDLDPLSRTNSEYDVLQTGYQSTIVATNRSPTLLRRKSEVDDNENQISSKRFNLLGDLQLKQSIKSQTQEAIKFSIPNEHEGVKTQKYDIKTKTNGSIEKKKPICK